MNKKILSERTTLFDPNMCIEILFEIKGKPAIEKIILALKQAYFANEATMSKVIISQDGTAYYQTLDESQCTIFVTSKNYQDIIKENERIPFRIEQGELIKTFIIDKDNTISIMVMAHHIVSDGKGLLYFIEDFMNALSGNTLSKKPMVLFTKESLLQVCKIPIVTRLYVEYFNNKWRKYKRSFSVEDYYHLYNSYWKNRESIILQHRYTKKELEILHRKAKEHDLSINNLIIAAFLKVDSQYDRVGIAINGRTNNNKSMSNQATGISINIKYRKNKSVLSNAKKIQKKIKLKLKTPIFKYFILHFISILSPTLVDSILFHTCGLSSNQISKKLADILGYTYKKEKQLSITNLTKIDILQQYGQFEIKNMCFVPPVVSYGKRIIGVVSDDNGMSIVYHFMNDVSIEREKQFFILANKNLQEVISQSK